MDKNKLKTFAIESRRQLIEDTKYQANLLGITKDGIQNPVEESTGMQAFDIGGSKPYVIYDEDIEKRANLVKEVQNKGFDNVIEEVAYTWFNRVIAIRYMEVNDYLPTRVRVLSSETFGKAEPDIIRESPHIDLNLTDEDIELIYLLKNENKTDELFQFLFIKQCNKLNEILPGLFEKTKDFSEILLNIDYTNPNGIILNLTKNIPEEDFKEQVEIIGWLYQYYISERKNEVISMFKGKINKNDIPAATQLFTPDWIVKYMVDNSLGKYWIERNKNSKLENKLKYYLTETSFNAEINEDLIKIKNNTLKPEDIKFFDPCMGSGHILVYAFDIFFKIYEELGYSANSIPELILKNNIYGLDIDKRAYQLAYFAILMQSKKYDKNILNKEISLNVFPIEESTQINKDTLKFLFDIDKNLFEDITYLFDKFKSGKEFGSLIQLKNMDLFSMEYKLNQVLKEHNFQLENLQVKNVIEKDIFPLINQAKLLNNKYEVVVTNPPYLNKFDDSLKDFVKKNYKDYSKDLFSMFIYRNLTFCKKDGYSAMMTPFVWMFLKSYKKLREYIIKNKNISSLIQLEYSAFSEATVPICTFVLCNNNIKIDGIYLKLSEFTGGMEVQNQKVLEAINSNVNYKYISNTSKFSEIPETPIAYWVNQKVLELFSNNKNLSSVGKFKSGKSSGKNDKYFKLWFEVNFNDIKFDETRLINITKKYIPLNKGGSFRRWYGNLEYVALKEFVSEDSDELLESITWSDINSSLFSARLHEKGISANNVGKRVYVNTNLTYYVLGLLNCKISDYILELIIPTIHFDTGYVEKIPFILDEKELKNINNLVKENIRISKEDWNLYEKSWNFKLNPLVELSIKNRDKNYNLSELFKIYYRNLNYKRNILKNNEEKLNQIFFKIYDVVNLFDYHISDKEISLTSENISRDIKDLISYSVGCMFGRYNINNGLVYAGGEWDIKEYDTFLPDEDNIIPILDSEYFDDDIVGLFINFIKKSFGLKNLEENLNFIAKNLPNNGSNSREIIRKYFLNNFYNDHCNKYTSRGAGKRPIYWQFDSGKENGFKCLVYMHRYSSDLVACVRTDYLHKTQKAIESQISYLQDTKENLENNKNQAKIDKQIKNLNKQLEETRFYDEALAHIASQNIKIDLDDGVKVNYNKFQNVEVNKEGQKIKKINLLKKI